MRIKGLTAFLIAAVMVMNMYVVSAEKKELLLDFENISSMPEGISYNNKSVDLHFDKSGADGSSAFGFTAGFGPGKGTGQLNEDSQGLVIDVRSISQDCENEIYISYDFLSMKDNMRAYLIAPVSDGTLLPLVTLYDNEVKFADTVVASIAKNEWHTIGVCFKSASNDVQLDIFFDGNRVAQSSEIEGIVPNEIEYLKILAAPLTDAEEFASGLYGYTQRNEIMLIDNFFVSNSADGPEIEFKATSVMQGDELDKLVIKFTKAVHMDSKDKIAVSGIGIKSFDMQDEKTVVLTLEEKLKIGETYTVTLGDVAAEDTSILVGEKEFLFTAKIPDGVNMFWDFNDSQLPPEFFTYSNKTDIYLSDEEKGPSGDANDHAFRYLIKVGTGYMPMDTQIDKYTNGFNILGGHLEETINDISIAVSYDFYPMSDSMIGWLIAPSWGIGDNYRNQIYYMNDGKVYFEDTEIGEWQKNTYHNIGAIYHLSSTDGVVMDVYYDGVKKISGHKDTSNDAKSGILWFTCCSASRNPEGTEGRYSARNEYFVMDNLYIGENLKSVLSGFKPETSSPADNEIDVAINTPVSVTMNDKIANVNATGLIELKSVSGDNVELINERFDESGYTITADIKGQLNYSDEYIVTLSNVLESVEGVKADTDSKISFKTGSIYPGEIIVDSFVKADDKATASVSVNGISSAVVVVAAYDKEGIMKNVAQYNFTGEAVNVSIDCSEDEGVKIFALDSIKDGTLLAEPFIENEEKTGYYQKDSQIAIESIECADRVIRVKGNSNIKSGYVFAKLSTSGKSADSEVLSDYLSLDAVRCNGDGDFEFAGKTNEKSGVYNVSIKAYDTALAVTDSVRYDVMDGNSILSMSLESQSCDIGSDSISLKVDRKDVSGMLVNFTLSDKASLYNKGEKLISGESRINCESEVVLTVISEFGEEKKYTLSVEKTHTGESSPGGGYSSGGGASVVLGNSDEKSQDIPPTLEEITPIFFDVPKNFWASEAIEALYEDGIISGVDKENFAPDRPITREEFAMLLYKAFDVKNADDENKFLDIPEGAWYKDAVYALYENGTLYGIGENNFGVGKNITRQDMTVMLYRLIMDKEISVVREYKAFADADDIAEYAKGAVSAMYIYGFVSGVTENEFAPLEIATRAQAAAVIYRLLG